MNVLFELVHWVSLLVATNLSLRLFRDLADLSQWIVQTPRGTTMWTFYRRHQLAGTVRTFSTPAQVPPERTDHGDGNKPQGQEKVQQLQRDHAGFSLLRRNSR